MGALNIVVMLCVSSILILSLMGGVGTGLYKAGSEEQTQKLEREANETWVKQMEDDMYEELDQYQDPRSKSFRTRVEKSEGFGQLPFFPSGAYFRRRPTESALLWPNRGDTLPNRGRDSFSLEGNPVRVVDNITDVEVEWGRYDKDAWTNLWAKDDLRVDCGSDAINSFQIRSEKFGVPRDIIKEKKNVETETSLLFKHQFRSYHDNYKQVFRCLTGAPGWTWTKEEGNKMCSDTARCRKQIGGEFKTPISDQRTNTLQARKPDKNFNKIMDCDFKSVGAGEYGADAAGKNFPLTTIVPKWENSMVKQNFRFGGAQTNDIRLDPNLMEFDFKCNKQPVAGPCRPVKYTEWTPFFSSQGDGIRELRHLAKNARVAKTSHENISVSDQLQRKLPYQGKGKMDPIKGLGKVRCSPTEALTRVDFEVSEGLKAPKDWIRFAYTCCKM